MKFKKYILLLGLSFLIAISLRMFVFRTYLVMSNSMAPTLLEGDQILAINVQPTGLKIENHDIIIFKKPISNLILDYPEPKRIREELLIKRVVSNFASNQPIFLVAGDNLNQSISAQEMGEVFYQQIIGLAVLKFYPLNRLSFIH